MPSLARELFPGGKRVGLRQSMDLERLNLFGMLEFLDAAAVGAPHFEAAPGDIIGKDPMVADGAGHIAVCIAGVLHLRGDMFKGEIHQINI